MRVGLDLDGVCYDFAAAFRHFLVDHCGYDPKRCGDPYRWEFYLDWGLTLVEFLDVCAAGVDAGVLFTWGDPYPGVVDAVQRIKAAGHTIHVITDRTHGQPGASARATAAWLHAHAIPYDSLTFAADKTVVQTHCMVDDKLQNYDALDRVGCWAYLLDRPWNKDPHRVADSRVRVPDLSTFADDILSGRAA